ncbi:MAG TPA: MraY family glycosyltransferase [Fimbriiglobus sp.]|nr:MraY family glycosyltransferase [Fimbriiglobus sp.]
MIDTVVVLGLGIGFGLAAVAGARAVAFRIGFVDRPDGRRKLQTRPVAVAGGVGVLVAVVAALAVSAAVVPEVGRILGGEPARTVTLLTAALMIAAVGLLDDLTNMRARYKLAGQLAAILPLILFGGFRIELVSVLGVSVPLGYLSVPVTIFWFLAAINALNLLDGMDGLLGTVGLIILAALAWMAFAAGHPYTGWVAVALVGSLVGFLRYNLPPATVYLGDCGSMLIGLAVGALALEASLKGPAVAIVAPAALLVLPILDTTAAIVRRKLTGRGLAVSDRGHLHHMMLRRGLTRGRVLAVVAALGAVAAGGALAGTFLQNDLFAALSAVVVVLILLVSGLFGSAEVRLIKERATAVYRAALRGGRHVELSVRLQGTGDWAEVWRRLVAQADDLELSSVRLDVNAPAWHEGFHGRWDRKSQAGDPLGAWRLELPVFGHGQLIGRLSVAGERTDDAPVADQFARLARTVAAVELAAGLTLTPPPVPVRTAVDDGTRTTRTLETAAHPLTASS